MSIDHEVSAREYLARKVRWVWGIAVPSWVLVAATIISEQPPALAFLGLAGAFGSTLWGVFFIRCPRCRGRLGQLFVNQLPGFGKYKINFCPYCGLNLDERVQA